MMLNNKIAWEHRVYEWRVESQGKPKELALKIKENPESYLRFHCEYFGDVKNKKVGNICGSDGQRAVALAILGANTTVFDFSEPQKKYAEELAEAAGVKINYILGDFADLNVTCYERYFDNLYCEGGILHYFLDLDLFFEKCFSILKEGGEFILSDYHPFQKAFASNVQRRNVEKTKGNYFDTEIHEGHVPYAKYFAEDSQRAFPTCRLRFYNLEEIMNATIHAGFRIMEFREHPKYNNALIPGEFTLVLKT